jgi:ATP synthase protein I
MNHDSLVLTLIIEEQAEMSKPGKNKSVLQMADLVNMGMAMVLSIVLGLIAGIYLDRWLGTEPIFVLVFIFGGILAGFRIMYKTYMKFFAQENSGDSDDTGNG